MEDKAANIGHRVTVTGGPHKGLLGTIKYYGTVEGTVGNWYGVELDVSL